MKFIRYFLWVTAAITSIGSVILMDEGDFDVFTFWSLLALWLSVYYMQEAKDKVE